MAISQLFSSYAGSLFSYLKASLGMCWEIIGYYYYWIVCVL